MEEKADKMVSKSQFKEAMCRLEFFYFSFFPKMLKFNCIFRRPPSNEIFYFFSIDIIGTGQCVKELVRTECEDKTTKAVSLIFDFIIDYAKNKLECPAESKSENDI